VPRLGSRVDAVLISGPAIFAIEFKCGERQFRLHDNQAYLLNAYRVLLTRARQGMVIFVPPGDESDPTRAPAFYDDTYEYLTAIGVAEI
jgi:schlafen family protein